MTTPLSSHGTLVAVQLTPGGAFTDIAELGDVMLPEMSRNAFDASVQNRNIDSKVYGMLRRGDSMLPLNYLPSNGTHSFAAGVGMLLVNNTLTGWRFTLPDSTVWILSGQVSKITPKAPVDGKLAADVTVGFSDVMQIGATTIGT